MNSNLHYHIYQSPIGNILLSALENVLTEVRFIQEEAGQYSYSRKTPVFEQATTWLDTYFKGEDPGAIPPFHLEGTPFRLLVWQILQDIPYGQTVTYKDIAREICSQTGKEQMSAQAVGNAVGHNPIGIFIPCHRVIGTNGNLTGYAGGLDKKLILLKTEHIDTTGMFFPRQ